MPIGATPARWSSTAAALAIGCPRDAIAAGIAYLPEDRKDQGLVLAMPGHENLVMASLERHGALGFVSWRGVRRAAAASLASCSSAAGSEAPARHRLGWQSAEARDR